MPDKPTLENISVEELEQLLLARRATEHEAKQAELKEARAKVKELEAYFDIPEAPKKRGRKPGSKAAPVAGKKRRKRGNLRQDILDVLTANELPLKEVVKAVGGNYGTVAQLLARLKKEKVITQGTGRGAPYAVVK